MRLKVSPRLIRWPSPCKACSTVTSRANPRRCCKAIKRLANPSDAAPNATPTPAPLTSSLLESSPDTARLVVLGSGEFVDDVVLQLSSRLTQDRYLNNLQLMQNAVDWSVADLDLLSIRSRGTTSHVLNPMDQSEESRWEFFNYAIASGDPDRHWSGMVLPAAQRTTDRAGTHRRGEEIMKRRNQILAGLLGAQIVLIVLVFLPRVLPSQNQSGPLLGNVQASDIVKMTISDKDGKSLTLAKQGADWTLPDFENYTAKSDQVTQFITKLIGIKTDVLATNTASSLKRLQVADDDFVRKIDLQGADGNGAHAVSGHRFRRRRESRAPGRPGQRLCGARHQRV